MVNKYDNECKVMILELLNSGIKTKQVSEDYGLSRSALYASNKMKNLCNFNLKITQSMVERKIAGTML